MKLINQKFAIELAADEMEIALNALGHQAASLRIHGNINRAKNGPNQNKRDELTKKTQELYYQFFWCLYKEHGPYEGEVPKKSKIP